MKFILGRKIEMTQTWQDSQRQAVTAVQAGPCRVVQVKTKERDGYQAVQLGFGNRRAKRLAKAQQGHFGALGNFAVTREFRLDKNLSASDQAQLQPGDIITVDVFKVGDQVKITGWSKGRGFQGVVKRHGFHGQDKTHGNKDQLRMPGSIGAGGVQHVFKGVRMPGQMGNARVTLTNLKVTAVDPEKNIIYLNGSVPGARHGLVLISGL